MAASTDILTLARNRNMIRMVMMMASLRESTMLDMLVSMMFLWVSTTLKAMWGYFLSIWGRYLFRDVKVVVTWPRGDRRMFIPMALSPLP